MSNKKLLVALLGLVVACIVVFYPAEKPKVEAIEKAAQGVIEALPDAPPSTQPTTLPSPGGSQ